MLLWSNLILISHGKVTYFASFSWCAPVVFVTHVLIISPPVSPSPSEPSVLPAAGQSRRYPGAWRADAWPVQSSSWVAAPAASGCSPSVGTQDDKWMNECHCVMKFNSLSWTEDKGIRSEAWAPFRKGFMSTWLKSCKNLLVPIFSTKSGHNLHICPGKVATTLVITKLLSKV